MPHAKEPPSIWRSFPVHPRCALCCFLHWVQVPRRWQRSLQGWPLWGQARAALCQTQLVPTDPLQGTAEPISNAGPSSMVTDLRQGKKCCAAAVGEEWEKCKRSSPVDTKAIEEGGEELLQAPEEGSPWSPWIFLKDGSPWRALVGAGEKCGEERAAERSCYGLRPSPHSLPRCSTTWLWRG